MGSFKTDKLSTNVAHLHEDLSYNLQSYSKLMFEILLNDPYKMSPELEYRSI